MMRVSTRAWLLLAVLALGCSLWCQAKSAGQEQNKPVPLRVPDSAAPTFSIFTSRDGLSDEIWSTIGFDAKGFVWAGSASGLARFDGYHWTMLPLPHARSLVRDMANDADGNLWAIFETEGLARYAGGSWHCVGTPRFYQRFSTLHVDGRIELWAAHDKGLARLEKGAWVDDPGNATMQSGRAIGIASTDTLFGSPREWLGSFKEGLWYRDMKPQPGPWQRFNRPGVREMAVTDLLSSKADDGHEELWVLSYGGGVARIRDDGVRIWRADTGELPSEAIYSAVETHSASGERLIWMASRAGLLRFRGDHVDVFDRRNGLPSDAVRGLKVQHGSDGTDSLWLATEGGMARATLSDNPWHTVSLLGSSENGTFGVLVEPDGHGGQRLWVGSGTSGVALLDDGQWRHFTQAAGELPARAVRGLWLLPGADGRQHRLLSMVGAPLLEITDALKVQPLPTPWPIVPSEAVNSMIARNVDGAVEWWASTTHNGVYRLRNGQWHAFPTLGNAETAQVNGLAAQIDGNGKSWLWAADAFGIARFDGSSWTRVPASLGIPADGVVSVSVFTDTGKQTLWAGTARHGVVRLDVTDPLHPQRLDAAGLPSQPDPNIYSVLRDSTGRIYVCTDNGVQQLVPQSDGRYSERVFHRRDGLVHDECNTNSQLIDPNDRYWVGTLGGLGMFDPGVHAAVATSIPKPLYFTGLSIDGATQPVPFDGSLEMQAGSHDLRIDHSLLTGLREDESRYRTQLIGYDKLPSAWTIEHTRTFSRLPPGHYRFRVEAQDFANVSAAPHVLSLTIVPPWWQRTWLRVLFAAACVMLAAAAVLAYNRGLRARQKLLRQQVAERTEDLRDANMRLTELSYLDPLTGVANRRRLIEAMRTSMERAVSQQRALGLIVADVDHFKDYNDRFGHLAGDVALRAIASAMQSAMREQDLVCRFGGEEFACLMVDANLETVTRVAERMRALVEALPPRSLGNDSQTITISAGIVSCVPAPNQQPEDLLSRADVALYEAKAAGRNRVVEASYNGRGH
jgi:diguanylate cyclase (GGDEF)-like protein